MAKQVHAYRISDEVDRLIKSEVECLALERGEKVSEADVIELAIVAWVSNGACVRNFDDGAAMKGCSDDG